MKYSIFLLLLSSIVHAYTVVTVSTGAPAGIEQAMIAQTTNQFNASLFVNPLASNTYAIKIYGNNQNYNPPPTNQQMLNLVTQNEQFMTTVASFTYTNGWADGASYQQFQDYNTAGQFLVNCSSPTYFPNPSLSWDLGTCQAVVAALYSYIYDVHTGTPTVVPGNW